MGVRTRTPWALSDIIMSMDSVQKQVVDSLLAQVSVGIPSAKIIDLTASKITAGTITAADIRVEGTAETGSDAILIRSEGTFAVIRSDNFVAGSAGFRIRSNGNAEFNDILVRGDIESGNWDGASPANLATKDGTATVGFYLDSSVGAAQFQGDIFLDGLLSVDATDDSGSVSLSPTAAGTTELGLAWKTGVGGAGSIRASIYTGYGSNVLQIEGGGGGTGLTISTTQVQVRLDDAGDQFTILRIPQSWYNCPI